MAEKNTASWPPAPEPGKPENLAKPANRIAGWISLAMASAGVLLFAASFIALAKFGAELDISGPINIDVIWWGVALLFGVIGRRSLPGKIGLGISLIAIVGELAQLLWMLSQPPAAPISAPTPPSPP